MTSLPVRSPVFSPVAGASRLGLVLLVAAVVAACGGGGAAADEAATPAPAPAPSPSPSPSPEPPVAGTTACDTATGRVLSVGAGQALATPSAAAAVAQAGDVVRIAAGDYRGDVAVWSASNLTICGVGGRAHLYADGRNARGKGIWVVSGANITIDSVAFHNATVPDQNGAGIRAEHTGRLTILNSGFYDNENGILGNPGSAELVIEGSEFARNGRGDGYTHNLYVNAIDRLVVRSSYFHEARIGHNFKSRARATTVENSHFMDGPSGTSSYLADFPNGGQVFLRGNLFQKGPLADNPIAISYGAEGLGTSTNTLEMVHNTVAVTRSGGAFLAVAAGTASVRLTANLFAGTGNQALLAGDVGLGVAQQQGNATALASSLAAPDRIDAPNFWPNTALRAQLSLDGVVDAGYTRDSPAPYALRDITGSGRISGALQSAP